MREEVSEKMKAVVEINKLSKSFGKEQVLREISHSFERGRIHGIIGFNGSGKTVMFKCICGFLKPDSGYVKVHGQQIGKEIDFPKSLGMRERLGIAQAIMENPELLILDEPFNGLDKRGVAEVCRLFEELREQGKTILLAAHNMPEFEGLCDTVCEMDTGVLTQVKMMSFLADR